jgi:hypothetical protein
MEVRKPAAILGLMFQLLSPVSAQTTNDNGGGMGDGAAVGSNETTDLYGDRMWDRTAAKPQATTNFHSDGPGSGIAIGPSAAGGAPSR